VANQQSQLYGSSKREINYRRSLQNEDQKDKDVEAGTDVKQATWFRRLSRGSRRPFSRKRFKNNSNGTENSNSKGFYSSNNVSEEDESEHEGEDPGDIQSEWLWWLSTGSRKRKLNYEDVKLREDKRLGGLPRSIGYSSKDWWHNTLTLPTSAVLRDIRSPVTFMLGWGAMISIVYRRLLLTNPIMASHMSIPTQPHSLLVSSLGLLLVFRTNSAYQRFVEGRKIWEDILSISRDLSRMVQIFDRPIGSQKKRKVLRLLAAFPYLLRHRIRPNLLFRKLLDSNYPRDPEHSLLLYDDIAQLDNDSEAAGVANEEEETGMSRRKPRELCWVDKRTLPWRLLPKEALAGCARAQNRPLWVCDRMAKELATVADQADFTNRERMSFLDKVDKLSHCIGQCERIHQTVVPLNYARHSLRSLTMWLLTLPFALVKDLGLFTGPVLAIMVRVMYIMITSWTKTG
jgi:predicted membrane chloride channel (bestrophin family)